MREQMEQHRANPVCASCHKLMDPLGFALENFDAVGAWRTSDAGAPIDRVGRSSPTARRSTASVGAAAGAAQPARSVFVGTLTEKLLTYALGRGLDVSRHAGGARRSSGTRRAHDYRFSSLVLGIVNSVPFQMRMKPRCRDERRRSVGWCDARVGQRRRRSRRS